MDGPLKGLRVLEIGNMVAAPMAGALLADFGAHVLKVEHPKQGDDLRQWPPIKEGTSLWWKVTNRNKDLITLDLSKKEGCDLILRLVAGMDVLIENFRPGTMERWGLGYEQLSEQAPRLIMARISGYGQTGPYRDRPGYGTVAEAMSGIPAFTGFPDTGPILSAFPLVDALAGMTAVQGIMMALYERDRGSGLGQVVDVSLFESLFRLADLPVTAYDQLGIVKKRLGNRMEEDVPRNLYRTADDRYVAISAGSQRTFGRLAVGIGREDLLADPRFGSAASRSEHADELDEIVRKWFSARTLAEATLALSDADVVFGPVYDVVDIVNDPHYNARGDIVTADDSELGPIKMHGVVPKLSRTPGRVRHPGREMGASNEVWYREILGLSQEEYGALVKRGVI